jgi:FeS assembly protein IscX
MQRYCWTDVQDIAEALFEAHPSQDPQYVRFTDLYAWILALPEFQDDPKRSNERVLEAIQMAWMEVAAD